MTSILYNQTNTHPSFSDSFWDDQHKGVEIIFNKLRKSKETCEEIKKLYELRAQIEEDYGDRLLKLAQCTRIKEFEEGSFAEALSHIPSTLETTARAHIDLAQQLKDHLEAPLDTYIKEQREIRRWQKIENTKQLKYLHESDVARSKECYLNECMKLTELDNYLNSVPKEERMTIEKEIEDQRKMVAVADQVYRRSVDNLNSVNDRWIRDWENSANKFQEMEINRIHYLKDTLCTFASLLTTVYNIDEEYSRNIHTSVASTDIQKDISDFIQSCSTGTSRPAHVLYEGLHPLLSSAASPMNNKSLSASSQNTSSMSMGQVFDTRSLNQSEIGSNNDHYFQHPVTILTNPDEELKSVEHQRLRLESMSNANIDSLPRQMASPFSYANGHPENREIDYDKGTPVSAQPRSGLTSNTSFSNGIIGAAMKEVQMALDRNSHDDTIMDRNQLMNDSDMSSKNASISPVHKIHPEEIPLSYNDKGKEQVNHGQTPSLPHTSKAPQYNTTAPQIDKLHSLTSDIMSTMQYESFNMDSTISGDSKMQSVQHNQNSSRISNSPTPDNQEIKATNSSQKLHIFPRSSSLLMTEDPINRNNIPLDPQASSDDDDISHPMMKMPRPPPKDEKWIISSIRRPQQLPVRISNGQMIDKSSGANSSNNRPGLILPAPEEPQEEELTANEIAESTIELSPSRATFGDKKKSDFASKQRKPAYPLTIDIPRPVSSLQGPLMTDNDLASEKKAPRNFNQNTTSDMLENKQPYNAPMNPQVMQGYPGTNDMNNTHWRNEMDSKDGMMMNYSGYSKRNTMEGPYPPQNNNYQATMSTRDSSLRMIRSDTPYQDQLMEDPNKKNNANKKNSDSQPKSGKEGKSGRFSFFLGGKRDKKKQKEKEKEAMAAAQAAQVAANNAGKGSFPTTDPYQASIQSYNNQAVYQDPKPYDENQMDVKLMNSDINPHDPLQSPINGTGPICIAKALWPFQASIKEEISFEAGDILTILRQQSDGWWLAELHGRNGPIGRGLVPGNYMEIVQ
ncbi:hypothetical protein BDB01DRAFT_328277 [Pilobolus umbonatus]|nr:hypothetical protein BDB01DRAFT_328277 [Pilobolus umbonatus]